MAGGGKVARGQVSRRNGRKVWRDRERNEDKERLVEDRYGKGKI